MKNSNEADLRKEKRSLQGIIKRREARIGELRMEMNTALWKLREVEKRLLEFKARTDG